MRCIWLVLAVVVCGAAVAEDAPQPAKAKKRIAAPARLRPGQWPAVDGRLGDPAWQSVFPLDAFLPLAGGDPKARAETRAWVAYDSARLYVAFRCREPRAGDMRAVGERRDDRVGDGDSVHIQIAAADEPDPYFHLTLNPRNVRWDAFVNGETIDAGYDGEWESATAAGKKEWCAEVAIPWSALKREAPEPGTRIHVNLCRRRTPEDELTSWSQCWKGVAEPESFGVWTFR